MTKEEFLKSIYFMQLGQNINHSSWQSATLIANKIQKMARECDIHDFDRQLIGIKQCINNKNKKEALDIMASLISKRVAILKNLENNK